MVDCPVRILCVDDEPNVLKSLRRVFMDENYELLTVSSGMEGLELLQREGPVHLVISDYRMPEMNGVEFLKQVCERWPDTIRLVLSGYADTAAVVDAINQGQIYKFIPKPWNDDDLKDAIRSAVKFWRLNQENARLNRDLKVSNDELVKVNENLEHLVEDRTSELQFQNEALEHSQHILANLPLAVVGLDTNGLIVYLNHMAFDLFGRHGCGNVFLGENRQQAFPEPLNSLIDRLQQEQFVRDEVVCGGHVMLVFGRQMLRSSRQEGLILAIIEQ